MSDERDLGGRLDDLRARLVGRILPRTPDFGELLLEQARLVNATLDMLARYCQSADAELAEHVSRLEKTGDRLRERNVMSLTRAFSTTFDRGLTAVAIQRIDDVANYAKTTVRQMQLLEVQPDEHIVAIASELRDGGRALEAAAAALHGDAETVARYASEVHKHERRIEKRYRAAIVALFPAQPSTFVEEAGDGSTAIAVGALFDAMRRREVYRHLSNAADCLDGAGRILHEIAIATV